MRADETKTVCERVSVAEGRVATNEIVRVWHDLIGHLDFEVANRAATLALQDHNIPQVAPKHILAKSQAAIVELNAVLRKNGVDESGWRSEPEPRCEVHDLRITQCQDCIGLLVHHAGHLYGERLHEWAKRHVYAADSLVENGAV